MIIKSTDLILRFKYTLIPPFLGVCHLLCNLNLLSLLPNESEQENRCSKKALQLQLLQVKRSGLGQKQFQIGDATVAGPGSARDRLLVLTKCIFAA